MNPISTAHRVRAIYRDVLRPLPDFNAYAIDLLILDYQPLVLG